MRFFTVMIALLSIPAVCLIAADLEPISPANAAKKVGEKVVVRLEVKSSGGRENKYLNSEEDFKDAKNFTIFISKDDLGKFKKAGIEKPDEHFKGKTIDITGTVVLNKDKPQITVTEPDQIVVVTKEKKS